MTPLFAVGPICCLIPILLGLAVLILILTNIGELPEDDAPGQPGERRGSPPPS